LLYLDSGVFIHAALNREPAGNRARLLLQKIRDGSEDAASCALTFDELVWVVNRHRTREDALAAGDAFLALPNLAIFAVNQDVLFSASSIMRRYPLGPRDAIHASSAIIQGCSAIVSTDAHFDRLKEIRRKPL
jgi:predicted nucleic acid-binding protein